MPDPNRSTSSRGSKFASTGGGQSRRLNSDAHSYRFSSANDAKQLDRSGEYRRSADFSRVSSTSARFARGVNFASGSSSTTYPAQRRYNPLAPKKTRDNSRAVQSYVELDENGNYTVSGVLEKHPNGFGFLREAKDNYVRHLYDPFVACGVIDRLGLREGVCLETSVRPARSNTGPRVCEVTSVDGILPDDYIVTPEFDELVPISPQEMYRLEPNEDSEREGTLSMRVMDILTPLGKGQRALIVAPPRSGKTVLLQQISEAIIRNYEDVYVIVLLVDERPEEVTDFRQSVDRYLRDFKQEHGKDRPASAEVVASSLDCELESHIRLAQFVTKRCKRLVEMGKDVFLLLDSITRLARAYNKWGGNTGRTMTGGLDIKAMDVPKKIFSSARQIGVFDDDGKLVGKGGSLTIVGTALVDTGSRMDELIFQEFKGTGNMELVLDRRLADRRIWPAIDVNQSGTRHEELLLSAPELKAATLIRRTLSQGDPIEAMERLTATLPRFKCNRDFFMQFLQRF